MLLGSALLALAACGNPCRDLSRKICECKPSGAQRQACLSRVNARAALAADEDRAAQDSCADLIDRCQCAALAAGNLQACGLSTEDLAGP